MANKNWVDRSTPLDLILFYLIYNTLSSLFSLLGLDKYLNDDFYNFK